ncbi:MAG: 16S rRNA (guanine(527)-N(7))-methyltransferase RsmG [Bifidobacterium psychraerophilum]|uniref:16S rRNA (guanine(527)-N(7))-methyltransferase RsmG n=1 Tax=Bifidobacterium psychraerophilum TaxID=218140 RepID=UPI0039E733DE
MTSSAAEGPGSSMKDESKAIPSGTVASADVTGTIGSAEEALSDRLDGSDLPRQLLGDAYPRLSIFHDKLLREGVLKGIIGPRDQEILWERHILNSAAIIPFIEEALNEGAQDSVADLGSGGGFPGIIIASCLHEAHITLIEPMERRVQWLSEVIDDLKLDNVTILRSRAEDLVDQPTGQRPGHKASDKQRHASATRHTQYQVLTCRAVAPMRKLAPMALPLILPGGRLVALKGKSAPQELEKAKQVIAKSHGINSQVFEAPVGDGLEPTHVVVVEKRK